MDIERIILFIVWKFLMGVLGGILIYAATQATSTEGTIAISIFAALIILIGLVTELGEP